MNTRDSMRMLGIATAADPDANGETKPARKTTWWLNVSQRRKADTTKETKLAKKSRKSKVG